MIEEWKQVDGYEGQYMVSNKGRVKSLERQRRYKSSGVRTVKERILKTEVKTDGYCRVTLSSPSKSRRDYVHRLVAEAFLPNPDNKSEVNHINQNHQDNRLENLEYVTHSENIKLYWSNKKKPE